MNARKLEIKEAGTYLLLKEGEMPDAGGQKHVCDANRFIKLLGADILSVGGLVRYFRDTKLGLTVRQLDEATGVTYSHISNIENGHMNPDKETVVRLAKRLGQEFLEAVEQSKALL